MAKTHSRLEGPSFPRCLNITQSEERKTRRDPHKPPCVPACFSRTKLDDRPVNSRGIEELENSAFPFSRIPSGLNMSQCRVYLLCVSSWDPLLAFDQLFSGMNDQRIAKPAFCFFILCQIFLAAPSFAAFNVTQNHYLSLSWNSDTPTNAVVRTEALSDSCARAPSRF